MARNRAEYQRNYEQRGRRLSKSDLKSALLDIWKEQDWRRSSAFVERQAFGLTPNEDAKNFLRREIYVLGLALRKKPPSWDVAELISSIRVHKTTRKDALRDQIFHALLMGIYEEDDAISRQERWSLARELEYAARHDVPPELLCGFIYQSGGRKQLLAKLESGFIEPAFRRDADDTPDS